MMRDILDVLNYILFRIFFIEAVEIRIEQFNF